MLSWKLKLPIKLITRVNRILNNFKLLILFLTFIKIPLCERTQDFNLYYFYNIYIYGNFLSKYRAL